MLVKTAYENVERCLRKAEAERDPERQRAWRYTAGLWRRFIAEMVVMRPDELDIEAARIREIEAEAFVLGTSLSGSAARPTTH